MSVDKIMEYVTAFVASVGGISGITMIMCTIVKTIGGNSVKSKLAKTKIDTDNTVKNGLSLIGSEIRDKVNADITVDISGKLDKAVEQSVNEVKETTARLEDKLIVFSEALSSLLTVTADFKQLNQTKHDELIEQSNKLKTIEPSKHEIKPTVAIRIDNDNVINCAEEVIHRGNDGEKKAEQKRRVLI